MSILIGVDRWAGVCYSRSNDQEESLIGQHIITPHSLQSRVKNSRIKLTFRPDMTPRTYEVEFKVQQLDSDILLGTHWSNEDRDSEGTADKNKKGGQACGMHLTNKSSEELCCHLDLLTIAFNRLRLISIHSNSSTTSILSATSAKAYCISESSRAG
jgi:hypothetical protein